MFSSKTTSPAFIFSTAALAFAPTTSSSAAKTTVFPNNSLNLTATGARVNLASGPFAFPRCEQRITFAPFSTKYFIVGSAPTNLF